MFFSISTLERTVENRRTRLLFDFGSHHSAQDAKSFNKHVREFKPHVVIVEKPLPTPDEAANIEKYLTRKRKPIPDWDSPFNRECRRILRSNNIHRVMVLEEGLSEIKALEIKYGHLEGLWSAVGINHFMDGNPDTAISMFESAIKEESTWLKQREDQGRKNISVLESKILAKFPELEKEEELRVIIRYGGVHTPLFLHARSQGFKQVVRTIQTPIYFGPYHEFMKRNNLGSTTTSYPAHAALFEHLLNQHLNKLKLNANQVAVIANALTKKSYKRKSSERI